MPKRIPDATILSAALDVFAERGYAGATTREIAAAAGINEVTLFRRFKTKAALIAAAIEAEFDALSLDDVARPTGDLRGDLERIVTLYLDLVGRRGPLIPVLLSEGRREPDLAAALSVPLRLTQRMSTVVAHYQSTGELRPEPLVHALAALFGPLLLLAVARGAVPMALPAQDPGDHVARFLEGRLHDA